MSRDAFDLETGTGLLLVFADDVFSVASFDAFSCSLLVSFVAAFEEFESASEGGTVGSLFRPLGRQFYHLRKNGWNTNQVLVQMQDLVVNYPRL